MKLTLKILAVVCLLTIGVAMHADVTVGTYDTGNCYPFLCNDSGTNVGVSIDWQQAYSKTAFPGQITITNLEFYYAAQFGGSSTMINGTYDIYLGTSANPFNALSPNQPANRMGDWTLVDHLVVNNNGCDFNPVCTINVTPFTYTPGNGDLLLEIIVTNQDVVPNGSGNGYNEADDTGNLMFRTWCLGQKDCQNANVDSFGALVTTFSTGQTGVPEPGTLVMLGSGVLGVAGLLRRKINL